MIQVEKITIREFRGIRDLTLDFKGKNFAISGPNGTGKSGIVDALEFGLTGRISRLSGKGRGALSIKTHGPHVDSREHPERAQVTLDLAIPSLGSKKARITRNVKSPSNPTITPPDNDVLEAIRRVEAHPEFVLSRREIIKYVIAEPGARSQEIQALLQLEDLETTRAALLKISNATERELRPIEQSRNATRDALLRALGITEVTPEAVLVSANLKRTILLLPSLSKLEATTSIRDGLETLAAAAPSRIVKSTAKADLAAAQEALSAYRSDEFSAQVAVAIGALTSLRDNESILKGMSRDAMLKSALEMFDGTQCPVCQTEWVPDKFRSIVTEQRERLSAVNRERKKVEALLSPISDKISALRQGLVAIAQYCPQYTTPIDPREINECVSELTATLNKIGKFLPLDEMIEALGPKNFEHIDSVLAAVARALDAIPEPTERDAARDFLFVGQERLQAYRVEAGKFATMKRQAEVARKVFDIYAASTTAALNTIYQKVEQEFRDFYRAINSDDESAFEAQLTPSIGKLGFDVNFYGRGFFPPGAYHSEGHQDAMGLCLYLALMKHLMGAGFRFAVLDDVLMSVDTGHRRAVCALLKSGFPDTQFILTTHDGVWLRHMKTEGLIGSGAAIEFRQWNVDTGPAEWKDADVWAEIDAYVNKNEIHAAASLLRYHLEHLAGEYCAKLGARVEYREDGRYELGQLLPPAIGAMRSLLKEAKAAANSWGNQEQVTAISQCEARFTAAVTAAQVEQWQINPAVHYNAWENLGKNDVFPLVATFKTLTNEFNCAKCGSILYLLKAGHKKDMLRCACSTTSFSLTPKAA